MGNLQLEAEKRKGLNAVLFYTTGPHRGNFQTLFHLSKARPLKPHLMHERGLCISQLTKRTC